MALIGKILAIAFFLILVLGALAILVMMVSSKSKLAYVFVIPAALIFLVIPHFIYVLLSWTILGFAP